MRSIGLHPQGALLRRRSLCALILVACCGRDDKAIDPSLDCSGAGEGYLVPHFSSEAIEEPCDPATLTVPQGFAPSLAVGRVADKGAVLVDGFSFANPFRFHILDEQGLTSMRARPIQATGDNEWVWIAFELTESADYAGGSIRYPRNLEDSEVREVELSLIPWGSPFPANATDEQGSSVKVRSVDPCEPLVADFRTSIDALELEYSLLEPKTGLRLEVFKLKELAYPSPGMKHYRVAFYGHAPLRQVEVVSFLDINRERRASIRVRTPAGEEAGAEIDCGAVEGCTATFGTDPSEHVPAQVAQEAYEGATYSCQLEWKQVPPS